MLYAAINSILIFVSWLLQVSLCNFNVCSHIHSYVAMVHLKSNITSAHVSWSSNESSTYESWLSQLASLQ